MPEMGVAIADCKPLEKLSYLYGAIVASSLLRFTHNNF